LKLKLVIDKPLCSKFNSETGNKNKQEPTTSLERGIQDGSKPFALAPSWGTWGENITPCLLKSNGMHILDPGHPIRYITEREAERLQGFPDDYCEILNLQQTASLLGDGWTLPMIEHILSFYAVP
jgi:site-specific DNA-cytosine methylase